MSERAPKLPLTDETVAMLRVAKVFKENTNQINSMDYSPSGEWLITSADDDRIIIYDCLKGERMRRIFNSKTYGANLIRFTHARTAVIHGSTKFNDSIRYLSLHENKYLRFFPGHTDRVTDLCMSPTNDTFLSASLDKTLRLWDLRSSQYEALMTLGNKPVAAMDPEGLILAAGINNECIKLYDLRALEKGPFSSFLYPRDKEINEWATLKFSPDGRFMLICGYGSVFRLVDSYSGDPLQSFAGFANDQNLHLEASFSPDSQYVFSGSSDGVIHVWNTEKGHKVCVLNGGGSEPIPCVQYNPKYMMLATASANMSFWLPYGYKCA